MTNVELKSIEDLKPHENNAGIYNDEADSALVKSVSDSGILTPLLITHDNVIISGHRRLDAAKKCNLDEVPVTVFESDDELDIRRAIIHNNISRVKTNEQLGREARELMEIEREFARQRQADGVPVNLPEGSGDSRDIVGKLVGTSGKTVDKVITLVKVIDKLTVDDPQGHLEELRTSLNKSVDRGHNYAKNNELLDLAVKEEISTYITLDKWKKLSAEEKKSALSEKGSKKFNPTNDSIEWARWTWNPVTGCKNGCEYCYAMDQANFHYTQIEGDRFQPIIYPDRLTAPYNTKIPKNKPKDNAVDRVGRKSVFCCSMADLFGSWVPDEWIDALLSIIKDTPLWNYLLLTKFPNRYIGLDFPVNAWVGVTVERQSRVKKAEEAFAQINAKVKFLSCEPMLEKLTFTNIGLFDWVIVGGASKTSSYKSFKPPREWINHIEAQAKKAGLAVYEKTNLLERIREYPEFIEGTNK